MPKIFKPTIKKLSCQSTIKAKVDAFEFAVEEELCSFSPPVINSSNNHLDISVSDNSKSKEPLEKLQEKNTNNDNVDIDDTVSEISISYQSENFPAVQLFEKKQVKHVSKYSSQNFGDPPPPIDQPLDHSKVTLRSLLNWNPTHKTPPKIREYSLTNDHIEYSCSQGLSSCSPPKISTSVNEDIFTDSKDINESAFDQLAPQVCLDADGNIVLDETSLTVKRPNPMEGVPMRHVSEDSGVYLTNYSSFRRPRMNAGRHWTQKDNTRFYRALSTIGTDFYCMSKLFPNRSRTQLIKKFKREERLCPHLVDDALKNKRDYDVTTFYNSSDDDDEKYDQLTKKILSENRNKAPLSVVKKTSSYAKRMKNLTSIINSVLKSKKNQDSEGEDYYKSTNSSKSIKSSKRVKPTKQVDKKPMLSAMISQVGDTLTLIEPTSNSGYTQYKEAVIKICPISVSELRQVLSRTQSTLNT